MMRAAAAALPGICTGGLCSFRTYPALPERGMGDLESGTSTQCPGVRKGACGRVQPLKTRIPWRFKVLGESCHL